MSDVFPVLAKRWYGPRDEDHYWQLFSVHKTAAGAQAAIDRLSKPPSQRARNRRVILQPWSQGRRPEFMYQRNMVGQ